MPDSRTPGSAPSAVSSSAPAAAEHPSSDPAGARPAAETDRAGLPLSGILVADFSRVLAGPLASMTLADLGARVVKVERPGSGDDTRAWAPPHSATGATYFESVNRNKESVAWDLKDGADLARARALAARADVVLHNFPPGTMERFGLGYDDVAAQNPAVVYASISGFGDAAGRDLPGYDFIVQAAGGLMSITGAPEEPMKAGVALVDVLTAKDATAAILAALLRRGTTGVGAHVRMNLLSSLQGALANQGQAWLGAGRVPARMGNDHPSIAPYQLLRCQDGPLAVAIGNDAQFARFAALLGRPELAEDPRFATNTDRVAHRDELTALLEEALAAGTARAWRDAMLAERLPAGMVAGIDESEAFAASLGLEPTVEVQDREGRAVGRQFRHPVQWSPPLEHPRQAPPTLGADTDAVNAWLDGAAPT